MNDDYPRNYRIAVVVKDRKVIAHRIGRVDGVLGQLWPANTQIVIAAHIITVIVGHVVPAHDDARDEQLMIRVFPIEFGHGSGRVAPHSPEQRVKLAGCTYSALNLRSATG